MPSDLRRDLGTDIDILCVETEEHCLECGAESSQHQQYGLHFMTLAGQEIPQVPKVPTESVRLLRAKLILEEALETIEALGFVPEAPVVLKQGPHPDLIAICDGCADLSVVTIGTLSACGVPDMDVLQIVDINNLQKFGPGSYKNENGKWCKPPGFVGPRAELRDFLLGIGADL